MCKFGINQFFHPACFSIILFNEIFRRNRCRTKFIIKLTALLLKVKLHTKKARGSKCFRFFINRFKVAKNRKITPMQGGLFGGEEE